MTAEDDKALKWDGDDDVATVAAKPTRVNTTKPDATSASTADTKPAASGSFLLISYGILGGVYLIHTIGWVVSVFNDNRKPFDDFLTELMYQVGEYLAIASPVLCGCPASRKRASPFCVFVVPWLAVVNWMKSFWPERSITTPNFAVWLPTTLVTLSAHV